MKVKIISEEMKRYIASHRKNIATPYDDLKQAFASEVNRRPARRPDFFSMSQFQYHGTIQ